MTTATLGRWGNANALRIPLPFCRQLGIDAGSVVSIALEGDRMIVRKAEEGLSLSARMAEGWDGARYQSEELDWGEPAGNEVW